MGPGKAMLSLFFLRRYRHAIRGSATPETLRQEVAAVAGAESTAARLVGAVVYWSGAAVLIGLAGVIGGLTSTSGQRDLDGMQAGLLSGLLVGVAVTAVLLANRRWVYGRVRPPMGRRFGYSYGYEPRTLRRSLLTPVRAGLMFAVTYAVVLEGGGGADGVVQAVIGGIIWSVPLALLYWAIESFLSPARIGGGHYVLLIFLVGFLILKDPTSTEIVVAYFLASVVHVGIAIYEDL